MITERYGNRGVMLRGMGLVGKDFELGGLQEWVAGDDSLLLLFESEEAAGGAILELEEQSRGAICVKQGHHHEIELVYAGEDLGAVAEELGVSEEEVIEIHTAPTYQVDFMGFSPGFPYLKGGDERLNLPRRAKPRERIVAGSVAIGGSYSGIYSVASPGGWHVLGHTDKTLFSITEESFLFEPGDSVKFVKKR